MNIEMLGMNVLVKECPREKKVGAIFTPETAGDGPVIKAEVLSVGPGDYVGDNFVKCNVEEGDIVLVDRNYARPASLEGEHVAVVLFRDILAKLPKKG